MIAHCIFVMKYWVLSVKLENIMKNTEDPRLELKANLLFWIQIVLICITGTIFFIKFRKIQNHENDDIQDLFSTAPPFINVIVLINAFIRMRRSGTK